MMPTFKDEELRKRVQVGDGHSHCCAHDKAHAMSGTIPTRLRIRQARFGEEEGQPLIP